MVKIWVQIWQLIVKQFVLWLHNTHTTHKFRHQIHNLLWKMQFLKCDSGFEIFGSQPNFYNKQSHNTLTTQFKFTYLSKHYK